VLFLVLIATISGPFLAAREHQNKLGFWDKLYIEVVEL
jgi:hypothetical protein